MKFKKKSFAGEEDLSGTRVKTFFKKYIFAIIVVEVVIFVICWTHQLGLFEKDRMDPTTRPFPWQSYFLFAFLFPVCMTFFLGLFMEYKERRKRRKAAPGEDVSDGELGRPLFRLFLLFMAALGFVYYLDDILKIFTRLGAMAWRVFLAVAALVIAGGIVICGIRMFSRYRSEKKALQNLYRAKALHLLSMEEKFSIEGKKDPDDSCEELSDNPSSGAPPAAERNESEDSGV